jgi:hypothetical protein
MEQYLAAVEKIARLAVFGLERHVEVQYWLLHWARI